MRSGRRIRLCAKPLSATRWKRKQAAAEGLKLVPKSQGVQVEAALAYAMAGDSARAPNPWRKI